MSFVPSLRDCLHRLDRVRDTADVVAGLTLLNDELWPDDGGAHELNAAIARLNELHQLCLDMAANMRGGAGVPPTPVSAPLRAGSKARDDKPSLSSWSNVRTAQHQYHEVPADPAPGAMYTAEQAALVLDVSLSYFHVLCSTHKVPKPASGGGRGIKAHWPVEVIDALAAIRKAAPSKFARRKAMAAIDHSLPQRATERTT